MEKLKRREFLRIVIGAAASLLLFRRPIQLRGGSSKAEDWEMPQEGRISFVSGEVYLNERTAEIGNSVTDGDIIRTSADSEAEIELQDYAIFNIRENSSVKISDILSNPKVEMKSGWFLIIIKKKKQFQVSTPMTLAGVRGTVFFYKIISDDHEYFCDCNGRVDLFDSRNDELVKKVIATYHASYNLKREEGGIKMIKTDKEFHEDEDILKMAERFSKETIIFKKGGTGKRY
jgi:hypothetical protein